MSNNPVTYPDYIQVSNFRIAFCDGREGYMNRRFRTNGKDLVYVPEECPFKVSVGSWPSTDGKESAESMDVTLYFQGSNEHSLRARVRPYYWSTFEHGGNKVNKNNRKWITISTSKQDAKEAGIKEGDSSNGLIRVVLTRGPKSSHAYSDCFGDDDHDKGVSSCRCITRGTSASSSSSYSEAGIVHGEKSNEKYETVSVIEGDPNRELEFEIRMVIKHDLLEQYETKAASTPKYTSITAPHHPPTSYELNKVSC